MAIRGYDYPYTDDMDIEEQEDERQTRYFRQDLELQEDVECSEEEYYSLPIEERTPMDVINEINENLEMK